MHNIINFNIEDNHLDYKNINKIIYFLKNEKKFKKLINEKIIFVPYLNANYGFIIDNNNKPVHYVECIDCESNNRQWLPLSLFKIERQKIKPKRFLLDL